MSELNDLKATTLVDKAAKVESAMQPTIKEEYEEK